MRQTTEVLSVRKRDDTMGQKKRSFMVKPGRRRQAGQAVVTGSLVFTERPCTPFTIACSDGINAPVP
jgi:hypothetical protein